MKTILEILKETKAVSTNGEARRLARAHGIKWETCNGHTVTLITEDMLDDIVETGTLLIGNKKRIDVENNKPVGIELRSALYTFNGTTYELSSSKDTPTTIKTVPTPAVSEVNKLKKDLKAAIKRIEALEDWKRSLMIALASSDDIIDILQFMNKHK